MAILTLGSATSLTFDARARVARAARSARATTPPASDGAPLLEGGMEAPLLENDALTDRRDFTEAEL